MGPANGMGDGSHRQKGRKGPDERACLILLPPIPSPLKPHPVPPSLEPFLPPPPTSTPLFLSLQFPHTPLFLSLNNLSLSLSLSSSKRSKKYHCCSLHSSPIPTQLLNSAQGIPLIFFSCALGCFFTLLLLLFLPQRSACAAAAKTKSFFSTSSSARCCWCPRWRQLAKCLGS